MSSAEASCSGSTAVSAAPVCVGMRVVLFLAFFSLYALYEARRHQFLYDAGPRRGRTQTLLRSASTGVSPAFSMAASRLPSVKCAGGEVWPSLTSALRTGKFVALVQFRQ